MLESLVPSPVRRFVLASPVALLLLAGCASKTPDPATGPEPVAASAARRPRQDQQLITRDVITGTQYTNLFDVIQALRSNWLRPKNTGDFGKADVLQVYLDNQRIGGVEELRNIAPLSVLSVRYYDPIAAAARWGMNHGSGAIYVLTAKK
jgi:hypothetical protein